MTESKFTSTITKVGNSKGTVVPKAIIEFQNLNVGDKINITIEKKEEKNMVEKRDFCEIYDDDDLEKMSVPESDWIRWNTCEEFVDGKYIRRLYGKTLQNYEIVKRNNAFHLKRDSEIQEALRQNALTE